MTTIVANDLKILGVGALEKALARDSEAAISVRGKTKYIVMGIKEYDRIREQELLNALKQTKKDIKAGRFHTKLKKHFKMVGCD